MKTVKVRIAVAVGPDGGWNASGWSCVDGTSNDEAAMDIAVEGVKDGEAQYFVEAELAVPEATTVTVAASGVQHVSNGDTK